MTALLILLSGLCDWIRGGHNYESRILELAAKFGYGAVLGYLGGCPLYLLPAVSVLFWLGEKPGWGYPLGYALEGHPPEEKWPDAKLEWWQPEYLRHKPYISLTLRGLMWGVPTLALTYWWHLAPILAVSMGIAMPLSIPIAKSINKRYFELIRGLLAASVAALCVALITGIINGR